ncbi:1-aminocyclopropane-1-carboxylate oxidase-like [Cryptomeria japonica]|uniref:1-aminocyclopropane-1-carboxylate oxidase-like n=1 Tax=Cryptomeria japonica TaxID=3369 RepID=UPI0027D9D2E1|nr:1-aminocyclopropane-1-carboxylate oxidase-like [Cryptomeria japonica]
MAAITAGSAAVPVIDMKKLNGEDRNIAMAEIDTACQQWGFFQLLNHGIPQSLLDKVQELFKEHYKNSMDAQFLKSAPVQMLNKALSEQDCIKIEADWESGFFLQHSSHQPAMASPALPADLKEAMDEFAEEMSRLADRMLGIMDENLGLEKGYLKKALSGKDSPFFGTKMCHYPPCPRPDIIDGLRSHTDAGGIILLLQDDKVDGLQVLKDGTWFDVQPMSHAIVIDIGDQLEVITNGKYKSMWHRVLAKTDGNRMSVASFYNPSSSAKVYPAPSLVRDIPNTENYPEFISADYMRIYGEQKFLAKEPRIEAMRAILPAY